MYGMRLLRPGYSRAASIVAFAPWFGGVNLIERLGNLGWYEGQTLLEFLVATGLAIEVVSVEIFRESVLEACSGGVLGFGVRSEAMLDLMSGHVASRSDSAREAATFTAQFGNGHAPAQDGRNSPVAVKYKLDRCSGRVLEKEPKFLVQQVMSP